MEQLLLKENENISPSRWMPQADLLFGVLLPTFIKNFLFFTIPIAIIYSCDYVIPNKAISHLNYLCLYLATILLISFMLKFISFQYNLWGGAKTSFYLSNKIFKNFINLDHLTLTNYSDTDKIKNFEIYQLINKYLLNNKIIISIVDSPFILFSLAFIAFINIDLAFLIFSIQVIFVAYKYLQNKSLRKAIISKNRIIFNFNEFIVEMITKIHSIKSLGIEELKSRELESLGYKIPAAEYNYSLKNNLSINSNTLFLSVSILSSLYLGSLLVMNNTLSIGKLTSCVFLSFFSMQLIIKSINSWSVAFLGKELKYQARQKACSILSPQNILEPFPTIKGYLTLKNLSFRYNENDSFIFKDLSLQINPGDVLAIQGHGKSTFLSILAGLYSPTSGDLLLDSQYSLKNFNPYNYRKQVSFVGQNSELFSGSILENITCSYSSKNTSSVNTLIEQLGMEYLINSLPQGIATYIDDTAVESIARGFKQQILIARALFKKPKILILDQACNSLDRYAINNLVNYINNNLKGKTTTILATYNSYLLETADQIFDIDSTTKED